MRQERPTYERGGRPSCERHAARRSRARSTHYNSVSLHAAGGGHGAPQRRPASTETLALRLTEPLGMTDTTFDARPLRDRRRSRSTASALTTASCGRCCCASWPRAQMPGGGMFGTLADLLRLGRAAAARRCPGSRPACALAGSHRRDVAQPHRGLDPRLRGRPRARGPAGSGLAQAAAPLVRDQRLPSPTAASAADASGSSRRPASPWSS